ncbi:hypothetical protein [Planktothrix phage Pra-JY27]|nr:hypothetical protein [Planktothrix phage Pag-Yong1]WEV89255.1 hypothetical protein [Synechococcus phage MinM2]
MPKTTKGRTLAAWMFRQHRPCIGGLRRFHSAFGDQTEVRITPEWWAQASTLEGADISWLAEKLLPDWAYLSYLNILRSYYLRDERRFNGYKPAGRRLRAAIFSALYVHTREG